MEQKYWIDRKKASIANAELATNSKARLAHFELAGLYGLKAVEASATDLGHLPELLGTDRS